MDKKRLEEFKVLADKVEKDLAEKLKSNKEQQEHLRRLRLLMDALGELLEENAEFRKQYESKLADLIHKKKQAEDES